MDGDPAWRRRYSGGRLVQRSAVSAVAGRPSAPAPAARADPDAVGGIFDIPGLCRRTGEPRHPAVHSRAGHRAERRGRARDSVDRVRSRGAVGLGEILSVCHPDHGHRGTPPDLFMHQHRRRADTGDVRGRLPRRDRQNPALHPGRDVYRRGIRRQEPALAAGGYSRDHVRAGDFRQYRGRALPGISGRRGCCGFSQSAAALRPTDCPPRWKPSLAASTIYWCSAAR